ncbi:MAG: hypothetical protein KBS83_05230 [Lachnospiraceae bacterium]|nr:hypothetical protein [Candidatus Equihabitans merdae]
MQETLSNASVMADILKEIDHEKPFGATIRMSELWCEAKAFGAEILMSDDEFPITMKALEKKIEIISEMEAPSAYNEIMIPMYESVAEAAKEKTKPLIVGATGPFTLAGILNDSMKFSVNCKRKPELAEKFLATITAYLIEEIKAYKEAGADAVMIAEPSVCMIPPALMEEFSNAYIQEIIDAVQDEDFAVIYHNCGPVMPHLESIYKLGAAGFHFGSEVFLRKALELKPENAALMGNIEPQYFLLQDTEMLSIALEDWKATYGAQVDCILSTGCDLSPKSTKITLDMLG